MQPFGTHCYSGTSGDRLRLLLRTSLRAAEPPQQVVTVVDIEENSIDRQVIGHCGQIVCLRLADLQHDLAAPRETRDDTTARVIDLRDERLRATETLLHGRRALDQRPRNDQIVA